jgi:pyridoxal phosphate enzyme (YggS family)
MQFPDIDDRVAEVRGRIADAVRRGGHGQTVRLIAVTKTQGSDAVEAAWTAGIRDVGENKVQEALEKQSALRGKAAAMQWHLIGHLQRNKVKYLDRFSLLHALDSARLADAVEEFGRSRGAAVDVLVQVNVAGEETKGGFDVGDLDREAERLRALTRVQVMGVMTMAPLEADQKVLRHVFSAARAARETLVKCGHPARELSMGMSADYEVAVEEGATMVRLGTVLFGARAQ